MLVARGFPSDLDGHPQLAWMGEDWVAHVAGALDAELEGEMASLTCEGRPDMETRVDAGGAVLDVEVRLHLTALLRRGGELWRVEGDAALAPGRTAFAVEDARRVTLTVFPCDRCELEAGTIQLDESGLRRETFTGVLRQPLAAEHLARVREAGADAARLHALDPEYVPFHCPACAADYCGAHWERWSVFDEDMPSFRDCIRGRCPEGHERMLED